jgi:hypothetical protein
MLTQTILHCHGTSTVTLEQKDKKATLAFKAFLFKKCFKMYTIYKDLNCIPDKLLFPGHKHRSFLVLSLHWSYLGHPVKIIVMRLSSMYFMFVIKNGLPNLLGRLLYSRQGQQHTGEYQMTPEKNDVQYIVHEEQYSSSITKTAFLKLTKNLKRALIRKHFSNTYTFYIHVY